MHQLLSEVEEGVPSPDAVAAKARVRARAKEAQPANDSIERILEHRRSLGLGDDLTEEEKAAFARGETPDSFRDPMA